MREASQPSLRPGSTCPFSTWPNTARYHVGETSISWAPLSNARRHSRIRSFLAFSCNSRLSRNSDLKNVSIETSDGRRRRFLPKNSQPVEVMATIPLHWRTFRLACFPQKNHSSLSSKSPSSPPQETIAPSSFNSRRSTLQLRLQIADDLILLALSTCLVRICSARQKTKKSQRVTPVGTKLSRATNSFLPCNGITRCPTNSAGNSFLLARTKNTSVADCLIRANHCQMVAVTHQR